MTTKAEFEAMILEAIADEGDLTTLDAQNGVEIDAHGPSAGNQRPVEGWYTANGQRAYFSATITVTLDEYQPDFDYDIEDEDEGEDD